MRRAARGLTLPVGSSTVAVIGLNLFRTAARTAPEAIESAAARVRRSAGAIASAGGSD